MDEKRARQTGHFPSINVKADTLGEAYHKAIIACYEQGCRAETPKHRAGMTLGFDAHITLEVRYPDREPLLHKYGIVEDDRGLMQYILEVTHGIHNHWKKNPNNPEDTHWGYTYNERIVDQIPFMLAKIKNDWEEKKRISGRDYFLSTWRPGEDSILEQPDPPCLQNIQLRFVQNDKGQYFLNMLTGWRSRDDAKASLENNNAQTGPLGLHTLFARKVSDMLGISIKIGSYIDTSTSLHIYGAYIDEGLDSLLERMRRQPISDFTMSFSDYVGDQTLLKRIVACQIDAEKKFDVKNMGIKNLEEHEYNIHTFPYPADWDTWPKEWDIAPDKSRLR